MKGTPDMLALMRRLSHGASTWSSSVPAERATLVALAAFGLSWLGLTGGGAIFHIWFRVDAPVFFTVVVWGYSLLGVLLVGLFCAVTGMFRPATGSALGVIVSGVAMTAGSALALPIPVSVAAWLSLLVPVIVLRLARARPLATSARGFSALVWFVTLVLVAGFQVLGSWLFMTYAAWNMLAV